MIKYTLTKDLFVFNDNNEFYNKVCELIKLDDEIVLDFQNVKNISSTTIGIFFSIQQKVEFTSQILKIINMNNTVKETIIQLQAYKSLPNFKFEGIS